MDWKWLWGVSCGKHEGFWVSHREHHLLPLEDTFALSPPRRHQGTECVGMCTLTTGPEPFWRWGEKRAGLCTCWEVRPQQNQPLGDLPALAVNPSPDLSGWVVLCHVQCPPTKSLPHGSVALAMPLGTRPGVALGLHWAIPVLIFHMLRKMHSQELPWWNLERELWLEISFVF